MSAADVEGPHPDWRSYYTGPSDHEALLDIRGVGPARADLILRLYGSIDTFLLADAEDVAEKSRSVIGPRLAAKIQKRCRAAGLRSDWSALVAQVENEERVSDEREDGHPIVASVRRRWSSVVRLVRSLQEYYQPAPADPDISPREAQPYPDPRH